MSAGYAIDEGLVDPVINVPVAYDDTDRQLARALVDALRRHTSESLQVVAWNDHHKVR